MDLYEIRRGRLDVIAEEVEHQDLGAGSTTKESQKVVSDCGRGRATHQKSVNTNQPREDSSPSPTETEDQHHNVCKEGEAEVRTLIQFNIFKFCWTCVV